MKGSDLLGDLLSRGLEQLVERGEVRMQEVMDSLLLTSSILPKVREEANNNF